MKLSIEEEAVLIKLLQDSWFQMQIGAENWDLTEGEELILWDIIKALDDVKE